MWQEAVRGLMAGSMLLILLVLGLFRGTAEAGEWGVYPNGSDLS